MVKMLTLFGVEDLRELNYNELKRELSAQKFILGAIKNYRSIELSMRKKRKGVSQISEDKISFADTYIKHLEALMAEIEYAMSHKNEPLSNSTSHRSRKQIRQENEAKRKAAIAENANVYNMKQMMSKENNLLSWDKEKFMLIAADRGYQTNEAIIHDVGKELNLDRARASLIIEKGRFSWGQVLCLGAMLQMTPKEFCDTFLAGYFSDQHGEYRASYDGLSRHEMLKFVIRPETKNIPVREIHLEPVEVGADGKPVDEEEWFD